MTLPKPIAGLLAVLAVFWLTGCSVQKRTTAPGWHVERLSRQAPFIQVQTPKAHDNSKLERNDQRGLAPVVPRPSKTVQLSRIEKRLLNSHREAVSAVPRTERMENKVLIALNAQRLSAKRAVKQEKIASVPGWEAEVLRLLRKEWNSRQFVSIYVTFGVSWLVAAKRRAKAEQLCAEHGKSLEDVASEAFNLANEAKQTNKWLAWIWLGLVGFTVFFALGLSFLWFI